MIALILAGILWLPTVQASGPGGARTLDCPPDWSGNALWFTEGAGLISAEWYFGELDGDDIIAIERLIFAPGTGYIYGEIDPEPNYALEYIIWTATTPTALIDAWCAPSNPH